MSPRTHRSAHAGLAARLCVASILPCAGPAHAQNGEPQQSGSSRETPALQPICTDRPTKANVVCTVPEGHFQIESDIVNWTRTVTSNGRVDLIAYSNPTLKYGLGPRTDIQVNIAPHVTAWSRTGGVERRLDGVGDVFVRLKQDVSAPDSDVQVALIPYIKAPTARSGIGNERWEGGLIAPIIVGLPDGFFLNLGPQVDVLANIDGRGYHGQLTGLVNVFKSFGPVTLYAELWTAQNFDPAGIIRQVSADLALTYVVDSSWQLDVGSNFGLNRATPDVQVYLGVSHRF